MSDDRRVFLRPIAAGWVAADPMVGGPNYDEFVDDAHIAATLAQRPDSVVALDLPQHTDEARRTGLDFAASLPLAARHLQQMKDTGRYTPVTDTLFAYQLREPDGHAVRALVGLVGSDEFSTSPGEPGRIIRNEDVFAAKVAERQAHIDALGHLLSPVLLIPAHAQAAYDDLLAGVFAALPADPAVADTDERGVTHSLWPITDTDTQQKIGPVLDGDEFLVADGNHRSLAAQTRAPVCLVVVASAAGLRIEPYNRLLRIPGLTGHDLRSRLTATGIGLTAVAGPDDPAADYLYLGDGTYHHLTWPDPAGDEVDALPHSRVEYLILGKALNLQPSADQVQYVGGRDRTTYLLDEVDTHRATAALLLRPVTTAEFTAINAARQQMPRKSTWFLPKARAGLVIARVGDVP